MPRRVVRRGALDSAWDVALADFPPELRQHMRRYAEARQAANEARGKLTLAKIPHKIEWWEIDQAVAGL